MSPFLHDVAMFNVRDELIEHLEYPQEGPLALYKGWLPSVIGVIPYVGLNFAVYESLKASMLGHYGVFDICP